MKNIGKCWFLIFIILIFWSEMISATTKQDEAEKDTGGILSNDYVVFGLKTAAVAGATIVGAPIVLGAAGFTGAGIAAGSLAATYQSTMIGGTIVGGSMFAGLQSLGAAGLGIAGKAAVAAASGAGVKLYDMWYGNDKGDTSGCAKKKETNKDCSTN
ncbi:interferon alpha-inducible protein 6-like [Uloborus diversus]|uniref:interferon alpha-inducible protein 6-like n=1 Tax=Uloborus diversus TaxID=327109 RepID=UPI00240A1170|nr:interferon alpha-inducible protein 6-like [Uloborus diversus]